MTIKFFTHIDITKNSAIDIYIKEFKRLKTTNQKSNILGEERDFSRPPSAKLAELMHYHIIDKETKKRTSDRFLVYTRGFTNTEYYLIIAIIEPEAHKKTNRGSLMAKLIDIAESFRNQF